MTGHFESDIGRGAVLYDTRPPDRRQCCRKEGVRHLHHVTGVYEETTTGETYYQIADGTHTTREWIHEGDIEALFAPAGWSWPATRKPTYWLTRGCGVADHHDLMTDGGECRTCGGRGWVMVRGVTDKPCPDCDIIRETDGGSR